jgi:hypothetical protein
MSMTRPVTPGYPAAANEDTWQAWRRLLILRHMQLAHLLAIRHYTRSLIAVQCAITVVCAAVGFGAWAIAQERVEPMHSIMLFCAMLNATTILVCLRDTWRHLRDARRERASVFKLLSKVESDIKELERHQA